MSRCDVVCPRSGHFVARLSRRYPPNTNARRACQRLGVRSLVAVRKYHPPDSCLCVL